MSKLILSSNYSMELLKKYRKKAELSKLHRECTLLMCDCRDKIEKIKNDCKLKKQTNNFERKTLRNELLLSLGLSATFTFIAIITANQVFANFQLFEQVSQSFINYMIITLAAGISIAENKELIKVYSRSFGREENSTEDYRLVAELERTLVVLDNNLGVINAKLHNNYKEIKELSRRVKNNKTAKLNKKTDFRMINKYNDVPKVLKKHL